MRGKVKQTIGERRRAIELCHQKAYSSSDASYLKYLLRSPSRSTRKGLTVEDLLAQLASQNGKCYWSGIPMTRILGNGKVHTNMSLDRVDPTQGYVPGNVVICCSILNRCKQELSIDQFMHWAEKVIECQLSKRPICREAA